MQGGLGALRGCARLCPGIRGYCAMTGGVVPRVAVVGAGPAGFYLTQHLIKYLPACQVTRIFPQRLITLLQVDLYDALPVPYGLVRFGVAPDHPEVKNCITTFAKVGGSENVGFIGNTALGRDVGLEQLRSCYNVVVTTFGAGEDKLLHLPGEHLQGVVAARSIVNLYNGLPGTQPNQLRHNTLTLMQVCRTLLILLGS